MAVTLRIEPYQRDVELMLTDLKAEGAGAVFAAFAKGEIEEAKETNRSVLGRVPPYKVIVDGQVGASLATVKSTSVVVAEFELIGDVLKFISDTLHQFSPTKTGTYKRSHILLADGREVEPSAQIQLADEYVFINTVPYARKIERGSSSQAPNGVYEATAQLARSRFGNVARITYSFRTVIGSVIVGGRAGDRSEKRNPAVIVRLNR